jgi:hypothetical protein
MSDRPNDWVVQNDESLEDPYEKTGDQQEGTSGGGRSAPPSESSPPGGNETATGAQSTRGAELGEQFDEFDQSGSHAANSSAGGGGVEPDYGAYDELDDMDLDTSDGSSNLQTYFFIGIAVLWVFLSICTEL